MPGLACRYAGINFYDGQGFMVSKKLGVKGLAELNNATICVAQGTTHEFNVASWFRGRNMTFKPVVFESQDVMYEAFFAGRCDAITAGFLGARLRRSPRAAARATT